MVIFDTNIIIDHLRQEKTTETHLLKFVKEKPKQSLALSIISIQELYEGKSTKKENKEHFLLSTIAPLKILPYTYEVAQFAGEIVRDLNNSIEFADTAIAATAIINNCKLFTLNKKHFEKIKELELI